MYHVGGNTYELLAENKDGWNLEAFRERYSDVLERYDYVVGDWGYNQLRLRGFFKETNAKGSKDYSIATVQDYLNEYCNFGCAYFIIEKMNAKNARQANGELPLESSQQDGGGGSDEPRESHHEGIVPREWNSRGTKESREEQNPEQERGKDADREGRDAPREHIRDERHQQRAAQRETKEAQREQREPRERHHSHHERQERQDQRQERSHKGNQAGKEHQSPKQKFQQGREQHASGKQHANGSKQQMSRNHSAAPGQPGKHQQRGQQPQPNSTTGRP